MKTFYVATTVALTMAACRADPGTADYSSHVGLRESNEPPEFLVGPTPFDPSQPRLNFGGIEGASTESIQVNNVTRFFFIFDTAGDGSGQFTAFVDQSPDRVEGRFSQLIEHQGTGFWGAGYFWYQTEDVSEYENLYLSAKSIDPAFDDFDLGTSSGNDRPTNPCGPGEDPVQDGCEVDTTTQGVVSASDYGYVNDGEWHNLVIPLADFEAQGVDFRSVRSPLFLGGGAGESGEQLRIDNVFYE